MMYGQITRLPASTNGGRESGRAGDEEGKRAVDTLGGSPVWRGISGKRRFNGSEELSVSTVGISTCNKLALNRSAFSK
jgi:hypothetical protein